jgi:hypothetical protein
MPKTPFRGVLEFLLRGVGERCPNEDSAGKLYRFCSSKKAAIWRFDIGLDRLQKVPFIF